MRRALLAAGLATLLLSGCGREERNFRSAPPGASPTGAVPLTPLRAGPPAARIPITVYEENRWAVAEGQRLYHWFNCAGCHAAGGGGAIGPPLRDDEWIYGSDPENIFRSILEGRPDGMPAFEGRLSADDTWKLVAYVRTLAGLTTPDTWPARADHMAGAYPRPDR